MLTHRTWDHIWSEKRGEREERERDSSLRIDGKTHVQFLLFNSGGLLGGNTQPPNRIGVR